MALEGDGIYCTMAIPSLVVGTVGGGTSLATQRECLQLLGCYGKVGGKAVTMTGTDRDSRTYM